MADSQKWRNLMIKAQQGGGAEYNILLLELSNYTRSIIYRKIQNEEHLEDLVQEVLLSIHKYRHTYDPDRPFKPWFHTIINSRLSDFWRKSKIQFERELTEDDFIYLEAEQEISSLDIEQFEKALKILSQQQKTIIELLKIKGLSVKQAAKKLNMSESAIKVAAHRSYKKIFEVINGAS